MKNRELIYKKYFFSLLLFFRGWFQKDRKIYSYQLTPLVMALLFTFTYADNNTINGTCPGEVIEEISGANTSVNHTENGQIGGGGNDRYQVTFPVAGVLDINATNRDPSKNAAYKFYVSRNHCGNSNSDWNIVSAEVGTSHQKTVAINANDTIYIRLQSIKTNPNNGRHAYALSLRFIPANRDPSFTSSPLTEATINTPYSYGVTTHDDDGDTVTLSATTLPSWLSLNGSTLSGTPDALGDFNVELQADDGHGGTATQAFTIHVASEDDANSFQARDDYYTVETGNSVTGNVFDNDSGQGLHITSHTSPDKGTLTLNNDGSFTYQADGNKIGDDSFIYYVEDANGAVKSATVNITITGTVNSSGIFLPFYLINPKKTQNVIGNYKIAGNTVLCITNRTDGYGGTCQGDNVNYEYETSNRKVSKFLDIDNDPRTWDSTSSNINIPSTFDPSGGILWAGLFWQGRISTDKDHPIRYGKENNHGSFNWVSVGRGTNIGINGLNLTQAGSNKIKLKVDNDSYHDVTAQTFHIYQSSNGKTFAAFADVTNIVKPIIHTDGKHTFTAANLTVMEGRENSPGAFGGWSIVVIYAEDFTHGHARNLSIYNGFISIGQNDAPIKIHGFKLPKHDTVDASLSVFSGEGEFRYGYTPYNNAVDWMKISNRQNTGYQYMPGVPAGNGRPNRNNMFDAVLYGIDRDHVTKNGQNMFNDQSVNNDGVDVDTYDISSVMEAYRDANPDINTIYIKTYSNNDYITPSMMAYSVQLFQPDICYDFAIRRNEVLIPSKSLQYKAYAYKNDKLSFTVAIWDKKGDIDPQLVSIGLNIKNEEKGHLTKTDKGYYSLKNSNTMLQTDYADMSTPTRPVITLGEGRTTNRGGTIHVDDRYFSKFYFNVDKTGADETVKGDFSIDVNATMDFGSGPFWQILRLDRCDQNDSYTPTWYQFNVEKVIDEHVAPTLNKTKLYSLPTRIAGKDFDYDVAAYTKDGQDHFTVPATADGMTVDVEMIDISAFDDNSSMFKCTNASPQIIMMPGSFTFFDDGKKRMHKIDPNDLAHTYATRNATFRMWMLLDENDTIITDGNLHPKTDNAYYAQVYDNEYRANDITHICQKACTPPYSYNSPRLPYDSNARGCYACLRDNFATPFCARDNFAIRPKAVRVQLKDRGIEGNATQFRNIGMNNTDTNFSIAAGYPYELNLTVVDHYDKRIDKFYEDDTFHALEHISPLPTKSSESAALLQFNDKSACADKSSSTLEARFHSGMALSRLNHKNAGLYAFEIWDTNWTKVDQSYGNKNKTIFDPNCRNSMDTECNDCLLGSTKSTDNSSDARSDAYQKVGCVFGSDLEADNTYRRLGLSLNPYRFNLAMSLLIPDNNFTYMNDLDKSRDATLGNVIPSMSATIEGNVTALGADNGELSNYITGCAAKDVTLWLDRNMSKPGESNITTEESLSPVNFQQWAEVHVGYQPLLENNISVDGTIHDMNSTLTEANFVPNNDKNGSAYIALHYNFKKSYSEVINPVIVGFENVYAASTEANSSANMAVNYIPDGNVSIDENRTFYFSRVIPSIGTDGRIIYTPKTSTSTFLKVQVYCRNTTDIDCTDISASPEDTYLTGGWYRMERHDSKKGDGQIDHLSSDKTAVTFVPAQPSSIAIDNNGTTGSIAINYPTTPRPADVTISVTPDEWLKFNQDVLKNGLPTFILHFLSQGLKWKGTGKTGNVLETKPSITPNGRMNW